MSNVQEILEASRHLQPQERLELAEALWGLVAADDEAGELPLSEAVRQEIDRRWARFEANPETAIEWDDGLAKLAALRTPR